MARIIIISGSVYGTATMVAEDLTIALEKNGHTPTHQEGGSSKILADDDLDLAILCTSTTGSGDIPTNLDEFYNELLSAPPPVNALKFAVIALGDSSYGDTYCAAGHTIANAMKEIGGVQVGETLLIDSSIDHNPEDTAINWTNTLLQETFA